MKRINQLISQNIHNIDFVAQNYLHINLSIHFVQKNKVNRQILIRYDTVYLPPFASFVSTVLLQYCYLAFLWFNFEEKKNWGASSEDVNRSSNERLLWSSTARLGKLVFYTDGAPKGVRFTHPPLASRFTVSINQEEATLSFPWRFLGTVIHISIISFENSCKYYFKAPKSYLLWLISITKVQSKSYKRTLFWNLSIWWPSTLRCQLNKKGQIKE